MRETTVGRPIGVTILAALAAVFKLAAVSKHFAMLGFVRVLGVAEAPVRPRAPSDIGTDLSLQGRSPAPAARA